jgi:Protein of unknown function (DUF4230)
MPLSIVSKYHSESNLSNADLALRNSLEDRQIIMNNHTLKHFISLTTGSITIFIIICLIGIWRGGSHFLEVLTEFWQPSISNANIDTSAVVIDRLRGAKELTTSVFVMEAVVPTSMERKLGDLSIATTKLLYIARGEVKAGVDLSKLTAANITADNNRLTVQLPAPEILDRHIDVTQSRVYDYDRGFLGLGPDVGTDLQTIAQRQTLEEIVTAACSRGILDDANSRAKIAITELLTATGYREVTVKTAQPSVCH